MDGFFFQTDKQTGQKLHAHNLSIRDKKGGKNSFNFQAYSNNSGFYNPVKRFPKKYEKWKQPVVACIFF